MKSSLLSIKLIICLLIAVTLPVTAQTDGVKVSVFLSSANQKQMLVEQPELVFKQDYETENRLINIYPEFTYQQIIGFGAAFTETSAYNFSLLSSDAQQKLIEAYFGKSGNGFNFCRTHINACDFSIDEYTYVADSDVELKTFNIDRERKYVIPMIRAARKVNPDLWLIASPWSPPAWMKDNNSVVKGGRLLPQYYPTWGKYFALYLEEFKKEGIDFFGVTIQNEPKAVQPWESCIWTGTEEGVFAANYLRPALDKRGFGDVKIIIWDHNKERVMERARESMSVPGADKAIGGIGHHLYSGDHFDNLRMAHELFPDKPLIATENNGYGVRGGDVAANWSAIEVYAKETIMNYNHFTAAAIAWNLMVDIKTGGPYHNTNAGSSSAPVWVDAEKKDFILGPLYYTDGHFSRFIKRGAYRIGNSVYNDAIKVAAFKNPDGELVVIVLNTTDKDATSKIRLNNCTADINMPAKSLQTLIIRIDKIAVLSDQIVSYLKSSGANSFR